MTMHWLFDRFHATLAHLRERGVSPWQPLVVIAMVLVVFGGLSLISTATPKQEAEPLTDLFAGRTLTPSELDRVEAALGHAILEDHQLVDSRIMIPARLRGKYLAALQEAKALPPSFHVPTYEAIQETPWIENPRQRSQRLHLAMEKAATIAINQLPDVLESFVRIDVTTDNSLYRKTKASAVVGVKTPPDRPLNEHGFRVIQAMLLNFKAGLTADAITITDLTTGTFFRGSMDEQSPEALALLRQADQERSWRARLSAAIAFAPRAKLIVSVIPASSKADRDQVRCSISIPLDAEAGESAAAKLDRENRLRQQIQSAILPLIPHQGEQVDELIAVTVFDTPTPAVARHGHWQRLARSPNLLAAALIALAGVTSLFLLRTPVNTTTGPDPGPELKIFEASQQGETEPDELAAEQLVAMATENPEAVAESLTDFIDRAS